MVLYVNGKKRRKHQTWITGPSAKGSEYGTPSSIMSDPHESSTFSASAVVERSGSPAVTYGMKATLTKILKYTSQKIIIWQSRIVF